MPPSLGRFAPNKKTAVLAEFVMAGLGFAILVFLWSRSRRGWPAFAGHDDGEKLGFIRAGQPEAGVNSQ